MAALDDDYCDLCDLPKSQCTHGRPPPAPRAPTKPARTVKPRPATRASTPTPSTPARRVPRRWTAPDTFKPLILTVLQQSGGELPADEMFLELEILAEDRLLPGDHEKTPGGELRWQYAARRARVALIQEGLMTKTRPGVWELA